MPLERLGKFCPSTIGGISLSLGVIVFVTGSAGKVDEVREILAQGEAIDIESRNLDCEFYSTCPPSARCRTCASTGNPGNDAGDSHRKMSACSGTRQFLRAILILLDDSEPLADTVIPMGTGRSAAQ